MESKNKTKEELKNEKRVLEEQLAEVSKPFNFKQKVLYVLIVGATIQYSMSFLSSLPTLQLLVPPLVAMSIPVVYSGISYHKSLKLREEIFGIDMEIKDAVCEEIKERAKQYNDKENNISQTINKLHLNETFVKEDKVDISWVEPYLEEDIEEDVVDSSIEGPTLVKRK